MSNRSDTDLPDMTHWITEVKKDPCNLQLRYKLALAFTKLGYPDLAAGEAYKCLLLIDEASDDTGEYHELAVVWPGSQSGDVETVCAEWKRSAIALLCFNLIVVGSLRSARVFAGQLDEAGVDLKRRTKRAIQAHLSKESLPRLNDFMSGGYGVCLRQDLEELSISANNGQCDKGDTAHGIHDTSLDPMSLPDEGYVRREIYPWNAHESNRHTEDALQTLNAQVVKVAPKLEVKLMNLPVLSAPLQEDLKLKTRSHNETSRQLGLFAKVDIEPWDELLCERSLLTTNTRLKEPLCDACSATLPVIKMGLVATNGVDGADCANGDVPSPVPCPGCDDIVFCSQICLDLAQASYHPAVCGMDVETLSKDVPAKKAADALYTSLLYRTLAMSQTQDVHPLELDEVKYIWGDFEVSPDQQNAKDEPSDTDLFLSRPRTLPFSFEDNILAPLHMLEKMEIDIFDSPNDIAEPWVWNTLYAKFRGTASARISPRDGRPEVAAVHPMWCLANHSCDPNVQWEWSGEIQYHARSQRKTWHRKGEGIKKDPAAVEGGIRAGDEILNHYVDIDLPVQERREWGSGALGGWCQCKRCKWEAGETD